MALPPCGAPCRAAASAPHVPTCAWCTLHAARCTLHAHAPCTPCASCAPCAPSIVPTLTQVCGHLRLHLEPNAAPSPARLALTPTVAVGVRCEVAPAPAAARPSSSHAPPPLTPLLLSRPSPHAPPRTPPAGGLHVVVYTLFTHITLFTRCLHALFTRPSRWFTRVGLTPAAVGLIPRVGLTPAAVGLTPRVGLIPAALGLTPRVGLTPPHWD